MTTFEEVTFGLGFLVLMIVIYSPLAEGQPNSKLGLWNKILNSKRSVRPFVGTIGLALIVLTILSIKGYL